MLPPRKDWVLLFAVLVAGCWFPRSVLGAPQAAAGATASPELPSSAGATARRELDPRSRALESPVLSNMLDDQKAFWTRPLHAKPGDIGWFIPFAATTSLLIGSDTSIERALPSSPTLLRRSQKFSNLGAVSLVGAAGALYLSGRPGPRTSPARCRSARRRRNVCGRSRA